MKELSFEKMERLNGGNQGDCLIAIGYGTTTLWLGVIGAFVPVVGAAALLWTVGSMVAASMGYSPDFTACG